MTRVGRGRHDHGMTKTTSGPAAVLCIDPPWAPRDTNDNGRRGASHKYGVMTTDEIAAKALPDRAERHVLFLWRLGCMVTDAYRVLDAWGYVGCAEVVWNKLRPCQTCAATGRVDRYRFPRSPVDVVVDVPGTDRVCEDCNGTGGTPYLGLGHYTRGAHEVAIIARPKRGRAPKRLDLGVASSFAAPMLIDVDGVLPESNGRRGALVHSAKLDAFFALVERLYGGPRVEMFSRRTRPGWSSSHSDQAGSLDEVARVMREDWPRRVREERLAKARKQR